MSYFLGCGETPIRMPELKHIFFFLLFLGPLSPPAQAQAQKPRVLVLTNIGGDPNDQQSLVRFILYANELDLEGLCATSRLEHGQDTKPKLIRVHLRTYGQVLPNLRLHDEGYQSAEELRDNLYIDAADFAFNEWNERFTVSRWRPYFYRNFQARMG